MFQKLKAEQAQSDDQCADFLDVFTAWRQAALAPVVDKVRTYRLEKRVRVMWEAMTDDKRALVVEALLAKGYLPRMVRRVLEVFGGKVVEII